MEAASSATNQISQEPSCINTNTMTSTNETVLSQPSSNSNDLKITKITSEVPENTSMAISTSISTTNVTASTLIVPPTIIPPFISSVSTLIKVDPFFGMGNLSKKNNAEHADISNTNFSVSSASIYPTG